MKDFLAGAAIACALACGLIVGERYGSLKTANSYEAVLNECIEDNQRMALKYLVISNTQPHVCSDSTHERCIHFCDCRGTECIVHKRDYEIELHMDTVWVYSTDRLVGWYVSNWKNQIDSIFIKDNL